MKIKRYHMEDWLNNSRDIEYNLTSSGCQDFYLGDLIELCNVDIKEFNKISLGDNDTRGSLSLRKEICKSYRTTNIEEILVTNGSSEALFAFFNELLDKGDEVVIPFPAFQCLYEIPRAIGCTIKYIDLLKCKDWRLDINVLEQSVTKKTKLIIINNPHNPFGWTLTDEEIKKIGDIAKKNDAYLLFDEHYRYLPIEKGTRLISSGYDVCKEFHEKTYATGSMIKCFGIVGIRIGWLIGNSKMLSQCRDYKDYLTHTIPEVTDSIAYISLNNKEKIILHMKKNILKNIEVLNNFMERNSDFFEYVPPTGGVVCFPKIKNISDSRDFCNELISWCGVSVLPGFSFEAKNHIRLNYGIESEAFKTAIKKMQEFIDNVQDKVRCIE